MQRLSGIPVIAVEARESDEHGRGLSRAGTGPGAATEACTVQPVPPLDEAGPSGRCEPAPETAAHGAEDDLVSYIWVFFSACLH